MSINVRIESSIRIESLTYYAMPCARLGSAFTILLLKRNDLMFASFTLIKESYHQARTKILKINKCNLSFTIA